MDGEVLAKPSQPGASLLSKGKDFHCTDQQVAL
jgi:hypothetical protein